MIREEHAKEILTYNATIELFKHFISLIDNIKDDSKEAKVVLNPTGTKIKKCLSSLYSPSLLDEEKEFEDSILLCIKYGVINCEFKDKKVTYPLYKRKADLVFNGEFETTFRKLLNLEISNYNEQWYEAINKANINSNKRDELLNLSPIEYKGKSAKEIIDRIELYLNENRKNDFVREVSAYIFFGHSKMLDNRQDLWNVFEVRQSPIQILIYNECYSNKILFIENKQTFESMKLKQNITDKYILIYLSGFMGTAIRLKEKRYRAFYQSGMKNDDSNLNSIFDNQDLYQYFFWGDFDYAGLNIFLSLKKIFDTLSFWEIGYEKMIHMVKNNLGHTKDILRKENQKKPNLNQEQLLNNNYIEIMNKYGFYDQEGILI